MEIRVLLKDRHVPINTIAIVIIARGFVPLETKPPDKSVRQTVNVFPEHVNSNNVVWNHGMEMDTVSVVRWDMRVKIVGFVPGLTMYIHKLYALVMVIV